MYVGYKKENELLTVPSLPIFLVHLHILWSPTALYILHYLAMKGHVKPLFSCVNAGAALSSSYLILRCFVLNVESCETLPVRAVRTVLLNKYRENVCVYLRCGESVSKDY